MDCAPESWVARSVPREPFAYDLTPLLADGQLAASVAFTC